MSARRSVEDKNMCMPSQWKIGIFSVGFMLICSASPEASEPPSLAEFAAKNIGWMLEAEVPLQERLGAVAFRGDRAAGPQGLEFYVDFNTGRFEKWCRKQGGKVAYESGDMVMAKTAGFLWPTAATKEDASWVCHAKEDGTVIGAVLRGATREVQVPYWGGGKRVPAYEFRYAFFEGPSWVSLPARRDAAFAKRKEEAEAVAAELAAAKQADQEKWERETDRLRSDPKVGDSTSLGMIVEVKRPLVLIQVRPDRREGRNASQEWVKIEALSAPR
jgi:hypothetical protein